jgi:hypothetical protein
MYPIFCTFSTANGFTLPVGMLPALKPANLPWPIVEARASAMMLRAEFPVQRKSTL